MEALFLFWEWFFGMNPVRGFHIFNINIVVYL